MLALIAGSGRLPAILSARAPTRPLIAAMDGHPPDGLEPDVVFRIERLGGLLAELRERGVTEICLAGAVRRPPLDPAALDAATAPLVPRLMQAIAAGDDAALRAVIAIFEEAGFAVRAAHDIAPDLLPPPGVPTRRRPQAGDERDAQRAAAILDATGALDLGQAAAVWRGQALALEGSFGTDWMLDSLSRRPDLPTGESGGLLYKAPKPGQERRADLPAIGPDTVRRAAKARLDGIVIEAGGVMALEADALVAEADAANLFLWIREPGCASS